MATFNSRLRAFSVSENGVRLALVVLIGFAALVSLFFLSHQSLRLDEAQSLWQSSRTPSKILDIVAHDVHVPLYEMTLHLWQILFGNQVAVDRLLSLGFFLATIPMVYLLGKNAYNRSVGLFAATLFGVSPFMNWYGSEIRMYTLLTLVTVLSQYFFLRIFRHNDAFGWIGYIITALLGIFTHYFFFLVLLTEGIFFLYKRREFPLRSTRKFISAILVLALAFAPWIIYFLSLGGGANSRPLLNRPSSVDLFNTFSQFIFGFQNDHLNTIIVSLWPVVVLLGFFALRKGVHLLPETKFFFLAAFIPIVLAFIVSLLVSPLYVSRYLIIALPSLYLIVGWLFSTYPHKLSAALKTLLVAGMLVTLSHEIISPSTPVKEDYRQASAYLTSHTNAQDVVILSAPFTIYPTEYYYTGQAEMTTLPLWNRYTVGPIPPFVPAKLPNEVASLAGQHQRAYLLLSQDQGYQKQIQTYFDTHYQKLQQMEFSPKLNLYVYQLRYDKPTIAFQFNQ